MPRRVVASLLCLALLPEARAQITSASPEPHPLYGTPVASGLGTVLDVDFGDLDEDGLGDLLATAPAGLQRAYGAGDGSFGAPFTYAGTPGLRRSIVADLDGDGHADVASGRPGAFGFTSVFAGDGAGGLGPPVNYPYSSTGLTGGFDIREGDADSDGDLDLAVCAPPVGFLDPDGGYLALLVNDGSGVFTPHAMDPTGLLDQCRALPADLDGDAHGDLLMSGWTDQVATSAHRPLLGQAGGGFVAGPDIPGASIIAFVADVDGDGTTDALIAGTLGFGTWLGQGDGSFVNLEVHPLGYGLGSAPSGFDAHDFDGDGLLDLVVYRDPVRDAYVFGCVGGGKTVERTAFSLAAGPGIHFTSDTHLVDLDGDGRLDFASGLDLKGTAPQVVTVRDVTYPAGGPLTDFGGKIRGTAGFPVQVVSGSFAAGEGTQVSLSVARPGAQVFLVAGLEAAFLPFKANVLVPQPDLLVPTLIDPDGTLSLAFHWPAGLPTGQTVDVQSWIADPIGIKGFAASSDAHIVQP